MAGGALAPKQVRSFLVAAAGQTIAAEMVEFFSRQFLLSNLSQQEFLASAALPTAA
jgi:hypothetical protein